ncbi:MFS transporter [Actinomadura alba]|uniref:MFS transporter n=1 Tax=Actinomadura alba TaxID=406431 RepID=A0ABR7M1S9_9ACTN|nr:MFS transporter [Actinomadura alba]MBC6471082.1 MFS transporter [Actinomadura alba]
MTMLDGVIDTRPLRSHPGFRRLWIGTTTASFSGQVALVAVLYQVWQLTHSSAWVGVIGAATAVPTIVFGLLGGALADAVDRRRVVMLTSTGAVTAAVLLAVQAGTGVRSLPLVLILVAAQAGCSALGASARRTFVPRLLPREQVPAGIALNHVSFQAAMLVGPAVAGLAIAHWGVTSAYVLDAAAVTVSLYGVARLPSMRPEGGTTPVSLRATWDGWRFIVRRPALSGSLATDLAATVLAMPIALFPVLNEQRFAGDPRTLGLFLSAIAVGGIAAGLTSGLLSRAPRPGIVSLTAAATWGAALAGFGLVDTLFPTLACLAVAGAADTIAVISRGTLIQLATPDRYLGRVNSVEHVVGVAGPGIGNARAGAVAGLTSASTAAITGGLACALTVAVLAATNPALRRWRHQAAEPGAATPT